MRKVLFTITCLLFVAGCQNASKETSISPSVDADINTKLQMRADSIGHAETYMNDFATVMRIMVVDNDGCLAVDGLYESAPSYSTTGNDHFRFEPGRLFLPVLMASIPEPDTAMMLPVGSKTYGDGECISDSHRFFDTVIGAVQDSMTLHQVLAYGSNVAMASLGEVYYYQNRASLAKLIGEMLPGSKMTVDITNDKGFYSICTGHGFKVDMPTILKCYLREDVVRWLPEGMMTTLYNSGYRVLNICIKRCGKYIGLIVVEDSRTDGKLAERVLDSVFVMF